MFPSSFPFSVGVPMAPEIMILVIERGPWIVGSSPPAKETIAQ